MRLKKYKDADSDDSYVPNEEDSIYVYHKLDTLTSDEEVVHDGDKLMELFIKTGVKRKEGGKNQDIASIIKGKQFGLENEPKLPFYMEDMNKVIINNLEPHFTHRSQTRRANSSRRGRESWKETQKENEGET